MRWQPALIARLRSVRDMRMSLAEIELVRADRELAASKEAEQQAQDRLDLQVERCEVETTEANEALLAHQAGGRSGIASWHTARQRARTAVQEAHNARDDAVSTRMGKAMACTTAREHWRDARLEVERLRMLVEHQDESAT